jgi:ribosomal RNA-processing protein 9
VRKALAFRKGTNQLYTASFDRTIKLFDLSDSVMGYVETLFGHQDAIVCLDTLRAETVVSAGSRDKTVRFWKIVQETQLVFRGGGGSRLREVLDGALGALEDGGEDEMLVDGEDAISPRKRSAEKKRFVEGSIECVAMIDESTFLSGGDSGCVFLGCFIDKLLMCGDHNQVLYVCTRLRRRRLSSPNLSPTVSIPPPPPPNKLFKRQDG